MSPPEVMPLEFTEAQPLQWDTLGKDLISPSIFHVDVDKLPKLPFDPDGFKPITDTQSTTFKFSELPVNAYTPENSPEIKVDMKVSVLPPPSSAQTIQTPSKAVSSTLDLDVWTLPQTARNWRWPLAMDSTGRIWMGSSQLLRIVGSQVSTVLSGVLITSICTAPNGDVWLWRLDGGNNAAILSKIDVANNLIYSGKVPVYFEWFGSMTALGNGRIYVNSAVAGPMIEFDPEKLTYRAMDSTLGISEKPTTVVLDSKKRMWLSTRAGINIIDSEHKKVFHLGRKNGLSGDSAIVIRQAPDGIMWVVLRVDDRAILNSIDPKSGKIVHYPGSIIPKLPGGHIVDMKIDRAGNLWISGRGAIYILNPKTNTFRTIGEKQGLQYEYFDDFLELKESMLSTNVSTKNHTESLLEIRQGGETFFPLGPIIGSCVGEDSKGRLWVGDNNRLIVIDSSRSHYSILDSTNGIPKALIQTIAVQSGKISIASTDGYSVYDPERKIMTRVVKKDGLPFAGIYSFEIDFQNNEWIGSSSAGVLKHDITNGLLLQLRPPKGLNNQYIVQIFPDGDGLWINAYNEGSGIIDIRSNTIRYVKSPQALNTAAFRGFFHDQNGGILISGFPDFGLYRINSGLDTIWRFSTRQGLSNNSTYSALSYKGRWLITTNSGVNIISPPQSSSGKWKIQTMQNSAGLKKKAGTWMSDGVSKRGEFIWADQGLAIIPDITADTSKSSDMILGLRVMDKDVTVFLPDPALSDSLKQTLTGDAIKRGYLSDESVRWDTLSGFGLLPGNLSLPFDKNVVQFQFSEVTMADPDSPRYAYILEGFDKEWKQTTTPASETYLNLKPGNYVFKVASKWKSGIWNDPVSYSFSIRPPWYQTWWAYLLYAIVTLSLLRLYIIFRSRQLRKENKLLEAKVQLRTDELQQSYNNVQKLEEIGKQITSSLSVETIIATVYNNVNELMDASAFGIGIYNENMKRLEFPGTYESGRQLPPYVNDLDDKNRLSTVCFIENKEIVIGDLNHEYEGFLQKIPAPIAGGHSVSLIYLPLTIQDKKLGVITVQSFKLNAYTDYHVYMLRNIAMYTAIALENATSYEALKATQAQLIQSEKMASLGELTAGIAHEIQNPLNFVNNFAEVNRELLLEMKEEIGKGNLTNVHDLVDDIVNNEEKIQFHGKRADSIVKGMLLHSRTSSGQKELTDINALCDEYIRLSYHGLRAKDKTFNANFKTEFDDKIDKINIIPQDVGRVLLNLINNAFFTVNEKKKELADGYQPLVSVKTKKEDDTVRISIRDNGNGIPQSAINKIFQPFFTTKPTGQGTGLGLSISYDIIRSFGGHLHVQSEEGTGSIFTIELPSN